MNTLETLWSQYAESAFNETVFRKSVEIYVALRKAGKSIEDADLFIAAFCVINSYTLVTNNAKHFINVVGLKIMDWSISVFES